jgi:hypothetical protein
MRVSSFLLPGPLTITLVQGLEQAMPDLTNLLGSGLLGQGPRLSFGSPCLTSSVRLAC